ncbi:hypothetical protein [Streptomyces sp. NBC_01304]|uniref:hypothetical protein n=1 Tax=Streptomyces sp. NBC_01304 TaxID=2903818 RepID=UPI002E1283C2|nr:hypothetical protein OG430_08095 [Streptomyces sp. NBC_01304]
MRAIASASVAIATVGALALGTAAATAAMENDDGGTSGGNITSYGFSVTPSTIAAGGQVTLKVDGCDSSATASSGIFDTVTIPKGQASTATVDWDAKPGAMYTVTFDCKGEKGTTDLTIATGGSSHTTPPVHHGVRAGFGGSLGDLDLGELGLGAALIAGALGSAYYWARRRPVEDDA